MFFDCSVGEDSWESLGQQGDQTSHSEGNQSWIFIGRTDAETEVLIFRPPDGKSWLIRKDPDAGKDWRQEEKRMTEDEIVRWHHWLNGHDFEQAPGVGDGQGSLACCSPHGSQRAGHEWVTELNCIVKTLSTNLTESFSYNYLGKMGDIFRCTVKIVKSSFLIIESKGKCQK